MFLFDPLTGDYQRVVHQSRAKVTRIQVRTALDKYLQAKSKETAALAEQLRNREITIAGWQAQMRELIANVHLNAALLAKGGKAQMTQADYGRAGSLIKFEYQQLEKFAIQIEQGLPLDGHFLQRAGQYAHAARHSYHVIDRREQEGRGKDEERNVLHAGDSCDGCLSADASGWQPLGTLPLPGDRDCKRNCKRTLIYR
jgi:hypothetical protein